MHFTKCRILILNLSLFPKNHFRYSSHPSEERERTQAQTYLTTSCSCKIGFFWSSSRDSCSLNLMLCSFSLASCTLQQFPSQQLSFRYRTLCLREGKSSVNKSSMSVKDVEYKHIFQLILYFCHACQPCLSCLWSRHAVSLLESGE